jgi:predicted Zn-ribbon and HTH transcriptional regulator
MGYSCQEKSYQWDKILAKSVLIVQYPLIMATKQREVCVCNVCGHTWLPEQENTLPARCASCKSSRWNREKPSSKPEKVTSSPVLGELLEDSHCETQPSNKRQEKLAKPQTEKRSRAQAKSSTKQSKSPRLQSGNCRHGFMVIDGVTACMECRS